MSSFRKLILCHLVLHSVQSKIANVAVNKTSWQSSTDYTWYAYRANDGNYTNVVGMEQNSCSHTGQGKYKAWWQVDLAASYDISRIILTTRDWDHGYKRLAYFSVFISQRNKTQDWYDSERCFYDENPKLTAANNRTIQCTQSITGRFVVVYNERSQSNPNWYPYSQTAILELCEVEVPVEDGHCGNPSCSYCQIGWYGNRCDLPCGSCGGGNGCQKESGNCFPQYCSPGFYGTKCNQQCSQACTNNICDFGSGYCEQCSTSTYGMHCEIPCPSNCIRCSSSEHCTSCSAFWYGTKCTSRCPNCGGSGKCSQQSGECESQSCTLHYHGLKCDQRCSSVCSGNGSCKFVSGFCNLCPNATYGKQCEINCPNECKKCDTQSICTECIPGFYGNTCSQTCQGCGGDMSCGQNDGLCKSTNCKPGYYGNGFCNRNCSHNCGGNQSCDKITGACLYKCQNGWYNQQCDRRCPTGCDNDSCDFTDGSCTTGCAKGFYGSECKKHCKTNCGGLGSCNKETGICSDGCKPGWKGIYCDSECEPKKFGNNCSEDCGQCRNNSCHHINGTCMQGCQEDWLTPRCDVSASKGVGDSGKVSSEIVGAAVGAVILLIIIVVVVIVLFRRSRGSGKGRTPLGNDSHIYNPTSENVAAQNAMYTNIMSVEKEKRASKPEILTPKPVASQSKPPKNADDSDRTYYNSVDIKKEIAVSELKAYVTGKLSTNKYEEEFQAIPYGAIHSTTVAETPKNMKKNRFKTTFPYDHSRVVLKGKSDYINANFIEDTNGVKKYIATQGPISNTIEDFWQMVWEYNIDIIVMLTNLQEGKKRKCEQYWPKPNEKVTHGQFGLSLLDERHFSYYSLRELEVLEAKTKQSRKILQYHFTTWPDHGTPDPLFLVLFHKRVISKAPKYDGPILVHCSAGIGRTGTFIALDALESQGNNTGAVDIENYVRIMRKDRMNMIQTSEQYKVLHEALVEAFQWQDTYISMDDFSSVWQSIETDKRPLNQQRLKKEYDMLREMRGDSENPVSAVKEENKAKNRTDSILPLDKHRPYLSSYFAGGNDFINSVIIPSHLAKDGFMVTQVPLQGTIVDFWRLITDHDSRCIVYFAQSSDEETNFYPSHEDVTDTEMHNVKKESSNTLQEGVEEVKMKVKGKKSNQTKDVTLLKIDMAGKNYPTGAQIFRAVEIVELQRNRNKNSPCTVVSLDGGTPCEVFCAISNILEYMKVDNRIDVFQTARQLQIRRPEFFETFETYRYCYQMINEYLMTQSVYFNM